MFPSSDVATTRREAHEPIAMSRSPCAECRTGVAESMKYPLKLSGVGDLRSVAEAVIAVLDDRSLTPEEQIKALRQILRPIMDFAGIATSLLGTDTRNATDVQIERYRELIAEYALSRLSKFFSDHPGRDFAVVDIVAADSLTTVVSEVRNREGEALRWSWRLKRNEDGYKVADIEIHGISLTDFLHSEVESALRFRDFEEFLEMLNRRL